MKIKRRNENIPLLFFFFFLAVAMTVAVAAITKNEIKIVIGTAELTSTQIAGVITNARLIVFIAAVFCSRKHGANFGYGVLIISFFPLILDLVHGIYDTIPGVFNQVSSIILIAVTSNFMKKEERHYNVLQTLSQQDSLTGMHNRRYVNEMVNRYLDEEISFYMCFMSIDNFKIINDTIGRDYGDRVLIEIANRFKSIVREDEFGGKITGAEFVLLIKTDADRSVIAERLKEYVALVKKPIQIGNIETILDVKTAVVKSPEDGKDLDVLYRHLDGTLNINRTIEKGAISFFNESITSEHAEAIKIEDRLFKALQEDLIHLVFQPQYTADGKKLRGFETLSRLEDEDGKPISPEKFIKVAERTNLIFKVDDWVLNNALMNFKPIVDEYPDLVISVNISARHFQRAEYAEYVLSTIAKYDFPAKNLEIEVTETAFAESMDLVKNCLQQLRDVSVKVALDDFGTGYASLSYLSQLPVNLLKIDKAFVDKLQARGGVDNDFVKVIITMGHILNIDVISEGVETEEQKDMLKEWGCDLIQGYLWGKPVDFDKAVEIINSRSK